MLTRSSTMNQITSGVEASNSHKTEPFHITAGPSCSATVDYSAEDSEGLLELSSSTSLPRHSSSPHTHSDSKSIPKKALKKTHLITAASKASRSREARIREIKQRALKIRSTGNTPATEQQRLVMLLVFNEITPYPDESWLSILSVLIDREYHQVKNWFSNQRQKDSRANRENAVSPTTLASSLRKITCENRVLRIRPSALECCTAEEWSDQFFEEVVMVHNVKILMKLRRLEAAMALEGASRA